MRTVVSCYRYYVGVQDHASGTLTLHKAELLALKPYIPGVCVCVCVWFVVCIVLYTWCGGVCGVVCVVPYTWCGALYLVWWCVCGVYVPNRRI